MTRFLACMFTLLQICLTPSKAILSPPRNLTVGLLDFEATAEWLPGQGNPPDTRYSLESIHAPKMSGGKWNHTTQCNNTAILKCELTFKPNELYWNYFVRVKTTFKGTSSNWTATSKTFQPYGDTRLSPPNVTISTEQKSIQINFSHCLESNTEAKPLKYLLYLFENNPAGELKFVALISTSESPYIFRDVPPGKNYCVSVSASHQKASRNNNFNTTKCVFLSDVIDSTRSVVLVVCIVAILLIIFSSGIFLHFALYPMRNPKLPLPKPLIFEKQKKVLKPTHEGSQPVTVTPLFPASEEDSGCFKDDYGYYQPRQPLTSSIASADPPEPDEEAEASNQSKKYTQANQLEDSDENETFDNDSIPPGSESESGSICTYTLNNSRSSEVLQIGNVNMYLISEMDSNYAEKNPSCSSDSDYEREVSAEEEEDSCFFPDSNSESGYEPRNMTFQISKL